MMFHASQCILGWRISLDLLACCALQLAGYGDTYGEDVVMETFQAYLRDLDRNAGQLQPTDANISQFLDFFLQHHEGGVPSGTDLDEDAEPQGDSMQSFHSHLADSCEFHSLPH